MIKLHSLDKHPDIFSGLISNLKASGRINISKLGHGVSFFRNNTRLFNTHNALVMFEKDYSPVMYVPKSDVFKRHFLPSSNSSFCPYKGNANYWSLNVNDEIVIDAVWEYSTPISDVGVIEDHVAFANNQSEGAYFFYEI
ncbi:MAG: DUF427 domain-containing protein [Gammaproteobacteria bacterium]|nr:DUF427 domain-containing protein [Gammaproteobacteria bacterium]